MAEVKIIKKINYTDTIKAMPVGSSLVFKTSDVRVNSIHRITYDLNKQGYSYSATQKGLINEIKVTRTA